MNRIRWIDTIKTLGMFLVFYGHYIEVLFQEGNITATKQYGVIYSFHMPLFFVLSGFFSKKTDNRFDTIRKFFFSRIVPVFSFAILSIPAWLIYNQVTQGDLMIKSLITNGIRYLGGDPIFNVITWFLVCLFTAEFIIALLGLLSNIKLVNLFVGFIFIFIGYFVIDHISFVSLVTKVDLNFWFIHESLIAIGFYLIGNWIYPLLIKLVSYKKWVIVIITVIVTIVFIASHILLKNSWVVFMRYSQHGDLIPFIVHALLGSLMVIGIALLIPPNRIIDFVGSNTLILLGLNGFFYHFLNAFLAKLTLINDAWWYITLNGIVITIFSMLLCYPLIVLMNKYLPQLFGKPYKNGPLLKSLDNYSFSGYLRHKAQNIFYK